MPNEVAFAKSDSIQQSTDLGSFQTSRYQRIRVAADCRFDSTSSAVIRLILVESGGAVGDLDRYSLSRGNSVQQVYEVPGTEILVTADAPVAGGTADIDVTVWGYRLPGE
jgi:hypothetical protein